MATSHFSVSIDGWYINRFGFFSIKSDLAKFLFHTLHYPLNIIIPILMLCVDMTNQNIINEKYESNITLNSYGFEYNPFFDILKNPTKPKRRF